MRHFQVTLTTSGTAYSLHTLVKTASPTFRDDTGQVILQSDDGNGAAIFVGGAGVTTAAYGIKLASADDSVSLNTKQLNGIWAVPGGASLLLNITLVP